ncbi:hypothetical protein NL676_007998 [Syzygium grande]|nr:hypothetical protein NL676_007998 [Syzygium grande]
MKGSVFTQAFQDINSCQTPNPKELLQSFRCISRGFVRSTARKKEEEEEMAISRSDKMNDGGMSRRSSSRLIPKRGQVKVGIVVGLAHSFAFIFSLNLKSRRAQFSQ